MATGGIMSANTGYGGSGGEDNGACRVLDALGRLVIPAEVRRELHLTTGDRLVIAINDGRVVLTPLREVAESLGKPK
jgi:AbrB family looped-hinge helix DNA binding protein